MTHWRRWGIVVFLAFLGGGLTGGMGTWKWLHRVPNKDAAKSPATAIVAATADPRWAALRETLHSGSKDERLKAITELKKLGPAAAPMSEIVCQSIVTDPSPEVSRASLEAFEAIQPNLYPHVAVILLDKDWKKIRASCKALVAEGVPGRVAVPAVRHCLRTVLDGTRQQQFSLLPIAEYPETLVWALGQMALDDPLTLTILLDIATNPRATNECIWNAAILLGEIGRKNENESPRIVKAILTICYKDGDNFKRVGIKALGRIGPRAHEAIPFLKDLKVSNDESMRDLATETLNLIGN